MKKHIHRISLIVTLFVPFLSTHAQMITIKEVQTIVDSTTLWINNGAYEKSFVLLIQNEPRIKNLRQENKACINLNLNLAKTFTIRRNYKLALPILLKVEKLIPKNLDNETKALIYISFADFYRSMEDFKKCDLYFHKARKYIDFTSNNYSKAYLFNRLAATYTQKKDVQKSIYYSRLCIEVGRSQSYYKLMGLSNNELGFIYYNIGKLQESRKHYLEGMQYSLKSANLFDWANSAMNLSILSFKNKNYSIGEPLLDSLIGLSIKNDWKEILVRAYRCKSWKADDLGDSLNYWKYTSLYLNLITQFSEVNTTYERFEKQRIKDQEEHFIEITKQHNNLRRQKEEKAEITQKYIFLIVLFIIVAVFSIGLVYFFLVQKKVKKELSIEQEKLKSTNGQLQKSLHHNEILIQEIHHRVKNNMQVISSLLDLQSDYTEDENGKKLLLDGKTRINSIAIVHEMMHSSSNLSEINVKLYVQKIVAEIKNSLWSKKDAKIHLHCDSIQLKLNDAIPIGILLNELLTNSFKHAKTKDQLLEINIEIYKKAESVLMNYSDNGLTLKKSKPSEGLGSTIIESMVHQLHGTLILKNLPGFHFSFTFTPQ